MRHWGGQAGDSMAGGETGSLGRQALGEPGQAGGQRLGVGASSRPEPVKNDDGRKKGCSCHYSGEDIISGWGRRLPY